MLTLISLLILNLILLLLFLLTLTLTLKKGSAGSIHIHSRLVTRLTSSRGEKILILDEENLFASSLLLVVHVVTMCFFWQKKNKREIYFFLMRFFSDSLRGGTGTWTFSWNNRNKNKQRYRQFVFKTSIVTQGKITTVKYFNKKNLPQPLLEYDQPSVEWGSPAAWAHRQGFDYSSHRNYCDVVITVLVVVVNVLNTGIFFMLMSRSDGKWRERSAEVASARSTRASTSSPRSRLTNILIEISIINSIP